MFRSSIFRITLRCLIAALSFFVVSCSGAGEFYRKVETNIAAGNYSTALSEIRENRQWYGDKSSVLYNLDMGLLFHYGGEYDSSINYFFAAEREIEDLYTKSISQQALSFLINDNILPYEGEEIEKVLVNVFLALDYAGKGMTDDALVEARKVDLKLREYARKYEEKNTYKEDAFIRYIAGVLYESGGEINDAFISYRKAFEAYDVYSKEYNTPSPTFLLDDIVRTATLMHFTEEVEKYKSLGGKPFAKAAQNDGSVIVLVYSGNGPIKVEQRPTVSIPDSSGTIHTFQVALPKFLPRSQGVRRYSIRTTSEHDTTLVELEQGENITAIAGKALDDRLALIYLKSGGRALLKFLASEKMKKEMSKDKNKTKNILGSLAIDLVVGATEQADLRTWRTLPAEIQIARLNLQPGEYAFQICDDYGGRTLKVETVQVRSGKASFVIVNDVR